MASPRGFEPLSTAWKAVVLGRLDDGDALFVLAGLQGLEPWLTEPESAVLPIERQPNTKSVYMWTTPDCQARILKKIIQLAKWLFPTGRRACHSNRKEGWFLWKSCILKTYFFSTLNCHAQWFAGRRCSSDWKVKKRTSMSFGCDS